MQLVSPASEGSGPSRTWQSRVGINLVSHQRGSGPMPLAAGVCPHSSTNTLFKETGWILEFPWVEWSLGVGVGVTEAGAKPCFSPQKSKGPQ